MKPAIWITLFGALLLLAIGLSAAAAPTDCTKTGTNDDDVLAGGHGRDVICGRNGDDYISGNGGKDLLRGGNGADTLVGNRGRDVLKGMRGPDRLFAVDGNGGEMLRGGKGRDQCFGDRGDRFRRCEVRFVGVSIAFANRISQSFFTALVLAEDLIDAPPEPPVPPIPTVTVTVTHTVQFPACTPPPASPPAPC